MRPIPGRRAIRLACVGILVSCFLTVFVRPVFPQAQDSPRNCSQLKRDDGPRLATGPADSSYFRFAGMLKEVGGPALERWQLCITDGTAENLELLNHQNVEFAIVQGDVMHEGWAGELPLKGSADGLKSVNFHNLRLVRRLFSEKLQIVTGPHTYVSTVADLKSKHIWMGPPKSGTFSTAKEVLQAAGVDAETTNDPSIKNYEQANKNLLDEGIAAFFRVTTVPVDSEREQDDQADEASKASLTYLFKNNAEVHLLNLEPALIDRIQQSPAYVEVPVYRNSYSGQQNGIMTIGLEAMLVTRFEERPAEDPSDDEVKAVNGVITDGRREIAKKTNIDLDLVREKLDRQGESEERSLAAHAHRAATDILIVNPTVGRYTTAAVVLALLILLVLSFRSKAALEGLGGSTKYIVNACLLIAACALAGVLLWYYEGRFNFHFHTPFAAAGSLVMYFARGFKTDAIMTSQGQLIALAALAVIATLVHSINSDVLDQGVDHWSTKLASWFFKRAAEIRPDEKHLVILNWDQRVSERMTEWMKNPANGKSKVMVVVPQGTVIPEIAQNPKIEPLYGDPKSMETLEKARVQDAKLVLISSAWCRSNSFDRRRALDVELADNYTIRAIYGIRAQECRSHSRHPVPIDSEILFDSNWSEAKKAGGNETYVNGPQGGFRRFTKSVSAAATQAVVPAPN